MTPQQQEDSRMIAEYMGGTYAKSPATLQDDREKIYLFDSTGHLAMYSTNLNHWIEEQRLKYLTCFNWQVEVWAKVVGDLPHWQRDWMQEFQSAINNNDKSAGFAVLVEAVKFLKG